VYAESIGRLIEEFKSFPGIGRKTAERMAFHILVSNKQSATNLANAIIDIKEKVHPCSRCYHITDDDPCKICNDDERDQKFLCVVEQPKDVLAIERMALYRGVYHVLLGAVSLLDGVGEKDLTIAALLKRVKDEDFEEVILATGPSMEGDTTASMISKKLEEMNIKVSRIARGLPTGSSIETVSKAILADALESRRPFKNQGH
jgi:recombination protein RecR